MVQTATYTNITAWYVCPLETMSVASRFGDTGTDEELIVIELPVYQLGDRGMTAEVLAEEYPTTAAPNVGIVGEIVCATSGRAVNGEPRITEV